MEKFNTSVRLCGNHLIVCDYPDNKFLNSFERVGNDEKLHNNLIRAKSDILYYGYSNPWDYFGTITIDSMLFPDYDFYDVKTRDRFIKDVLQPFLKSLRRKYIDFKYLIVPEFGEITGRLHFHCLVYGLPDNLFDYRRYKNGRIKYYKGNLCFLCKPFYNKFGEVGDFTRVRSLGKSVSYMTKYLGKSFGKDVEVGSYLFYHSQGLKKADIECKDIKFNNLVNNIEKLGLNAFSCLVTRNSSYNTSKCVVDFSMLSVEEKNSLLDLLYKSDVDI